MKPQEDPLKDVNPDDRSIIEKVVEAGLRAEGFLKRRTPEHDAEG